VKSPGAWGLWLVAGISTALLALPVVTLLLRAVLDGTLGLTLTSRVVIDALALSLLTSGVSLIVTVCIGTPLAYLLARRRFPGSWLVEGFVDLPIVLPPSVAGLALLFAFGRRGAIGPVFQAAGIEIPFTTLAVVVAQTFVSAPFFIRAARAGFRDTNRDLEDAARADGAGEWAVFRSVTVPLANAALAAGLVLAWARALGEFGATIMFAGNIEGRTQTLPLLVYSEFQSVDGLARSTAGAAVLVLAALAVLVAVRALRWRSLLV
jgi:molybdate transport system permease protein